MGRFTNISAILATAVLGWASASNTNAADGFPVSLRTVLAKHNPIGRLPNTKIRRIGTIRILNSVYGVYYLNFTNPVSLHGQQRIAIIKNGSAFMGAYRCTLGHGPDDGRVTFGSNRLTVTRGNMVFIIRFGEHGPSHNKYFCGEGSGWEDGI